MTITETEPRWHRWAHCEDPGGQLWRHGRAHFVGWKLGYRNRPYTENRHDLRFSTEWRLLPKRSSAFGWGCGVKVGTAGSEDDVMVTVHASWLGDLWLHGGGFIPNRFKPKGYDDRVTAVGVSAECVRFEVWNREHHHSRNDPWWMYGYWSWERLLFGRSTVTTEVLREDVCAIPLPEGTYPATYKVTRYVHSWQRFRPKKGRLSIEVTPEIPVPVPGKGENSWDCDDDGIWSQSSPGDSVTNAVAGFVESVTRTRLRHGGAGWVPDAGWKIQSGTSGYEQGQA